MLRTAIIALLLACALTACTTPSDRPAQGGPVAETPPRHAEPEAPAIAVAREADPEAARRELLLNTGLEGLAPGETGYYLDIQEARLRQEFTGTAIVLKRNGGSLHLVIPGATMFDSGSANLAPEIKPILDSIAGVLEEYGKTLVKVAGHTDSAGDARYNQRLSERRALSVGHYLADSGVEPRRIIVVGHGEEQPIEDNETPDGQARNRRVEVSLLPSEAAPGGSD